MVVTLRKSRKRSMSKSRSRNGSVSSVRNPFRVAVTASPTDFGSIVVTFSELSRSRYARAVLLQYKHDYCVTKTRNVMHA